MLGRGLQQAAGRGGRQAFRTEVSVKASLQFLTLSSPGRSGDWPAGGGRPLLHAGLGGGAEERPGQASSALVCWGPARGGAFCRRGWGGGC